MAQIIFNRVVARDCFGYVLLDFDFTEGIHSIEGCNGASKTSIFLTLMQGLFNKNAKGTKIEEVNNTITGLPYEIEIYFEDSNRASYVVLNSRKSGTIEIYKDGKPKHVKRIPDNLKIIEDILGKDYNTFQDLIYQSPKSSINLLEKDSDTSRKAFINKILKLDELDAQLEDMKQRDKEINGKNGRLDLLVKQLSNLESSLEDLPDFTYSQERDIEHIEQQIEIFNKVRDDRREELQTLKATLSGIEKDKQVYEDNVERISKIKLLESKLADIKPRALYAELLEAKTKQQAELFTLQKKMEEFIKHTKQHEMNTSRLEKIHEVERKIAELNVTQTKEEIESNISSIRQEIAQLEAVYLAKVTELTNLKECAKLEQCPTCSSPMDRAALEYKLKRVIEVKSLTYESLETLKGHLDIELTYMKRVDSKLALEAKLEMLSAEPINTVNIEAVNILISINNKNTIAGMKQLDKLSEEIDERKYYDGLQTKIDVLSRQVPPNVSCASFEHDILASKTYIDKVQKLIKATEDSIVEYQYALKEAHKFNAGIRTLKAVNEQKRLHNEQLKDSIIAVKKEITDLETKSDLIKTWINLLGPKGFRVHKIQSFLQHLNTTMLKYSMMLCDGRIKCMFFMEEGEIDFTVIDCNKTVSWACWSEGEKSRVKLPCLFAVLELLEVLGSVSYNVLALDEIFSSLDDNGKEGLFKVLSYLKNKGRAIYTISHTPLALATEYNSVIKAYKLDDGTTNIIQ